MSTDLGWRFDNSYQRLPESLFSRQAPVPVIDPHLVLLNQALADELGLRIASLSAAQAAQIFSGNQLPAGSSPLAQAYAGHQFGHFTMLGDGRAILLGEHITPDGQRFDIQLKGSGRTPYSRNGDGRAALGPMLREYVISEAMAHLGIPTTRSLAVVATGEAVFREDRLPGAILTRVAASHLRVGTFQFAAARGDVATLSALVDHAIGRHYPHVSGADNPALALLAAVMDRQIHLVVDWMRVGFIHGVMNTDNMSICGETIDYGPCAFMDHYDPATVFSSIDMGGRYAFANQSSIARWNVMQLAGALLPLMDDGQPRAIAKATQVLDEFLPRFQAVWYAMMGDKLGIQAVTDRDHALIDDVLDWMRRWQVDYTGLFRRLGQATPPQGDVFDQPEFRAWYGGWRMRLGDDLPAAQDRMQRVNPLYIPRNHQVEIALAAAEDGDLSPLRRLLAVLATPYQAQIGQEIYEQPPQPHERVEATFCGT